MIKVTYTKTNGQEGYRTYLGTLDQQDVIQAIDSLKSNVLQEDPQAKFIIEDTERPERRQELGPAEAAAHAGVPKESVPTGQTNPKPDDETPGDFDRTESTADIPHPKPAADERQASERKASEHAAHKSHKRSRK